jgi:hypothetical protein
MTVCDRCQGCFEVGEGLDAVDLAGLDQRGDAAPGDATLIMTGEEGVFAVQSYGADQIFTSKGILRESKVRAAGIIPVVQVCAATSPLLVTELCLLKRIPYENRLLRAPHIAWTGSRQL